jgi:hypothetical protein
MISFEVLLCRIIVKVLNEFVVRTYKINRFRMFRD